MPLFPQHEVDAAHRREAARNASLRATTAGEVSEWINAQNDIAEASVHPGAPGTVTVRLADGCLLTVTVSTGDERPAAAAHEDILHALAERVRAWLAGESGISQTWTHPSCAAFGVELDDGDSFTIAVNRP